MGSINSRNRIYRQNGNDYKTVVTEIRSKLLETRRYTSINIKARKAHDLLVAQWAVAAATMLSNNVLLHDRNEVAQDYKNLALNEHLFFAFFDILIKKARGY
jgi:hypothetical protein